MKNIQTEQSKNRFYFTYQLRLDLIPYIYQQAELFRKHCSEFKTQTDYYDRLLKQVHKRKQDLEQFYYQYYQDFRSPLILEIININKNILSELSKFKQATIVQVQLKNEKQEQQTNEKTVSKQKIKQELKIVSKSKVTISLKSSSSNHAKDKRSPSIKSIDAKKNVSLKSNRVLGVQKTTTQTSSKITLKSSQQLSPKKRTTLNSISESKIVKLSNKKASK